MCVLLLPFYLKDFLFNYLLLFYMTSYFSANEQLIKEESLLFTANLMQPLSQALTQLPVTYNEPYSKRQEAGQGPGNKAIDLMQLVSWLFLVAHHKMCRTSTFGMCNFQAGIAQVSDCKVLVISWLNLHMLSSLNWNKTCVLIENIS